MQFKNKLLGSAIASVAMLSIVGAANAATVVTTISGTGVGATGLPFANEVNFTDVTAGPGNDPDEGTAVIAIDRTGGTFPSGNLILRLTLSGAVFDSVLSAASVTFDAGCTGGPPNATSILSTGGTAGGTTVSWVLSNLDACGATLTNGPIITFPFDINGANNVTASLTLETESGGVPVDNTSNQIVNLIQTVDAYSVDIDRTGLADPTIADVAATLGPYFNFTPVGAKSLGDVEVRVVTTAAIDISPTVTFATLADVLSYDVTATLGATSPFQGGAGSITIGGVAATTVTSTTAFRNISTGAGVVASPGGNNTADQAIIVTPDGLEAIPNMPVNTVSVAVDLATGLTDFTVVGDLVDILRNGTFATLPWTASSTQAAGTGSQNFVRVSNPTGNAYGPVRATVKASTVPATVGVSAQLAATVAAGGELLVTAGDLQTALGNFGRADIEVSVEGLNATIKRLIQRTDGTYEINNVSVSGPSTN